MILKKNYLIDLKKNYEFSSTFFDYFTFNFTHSSFKNFLSLEGDFIKLIKSNSNSSNSSTLDFDFKGNTFTCTTLPFNQGQAYILYLKYISISVPFLLLYEYDESKKGILAYDGQIQLYGGFCALFEIGVNNLFEHLLDSFFLCDFSLSRVDIKTDLFSSKIVPEIIYPGDLLNLRFGTSANMFFSGTLLQSWNYGKPDSAKRNFGRKEIRMYNKFRDIERVKNHALYSRAFSYATFHRFEIQLMYKEVNMIRSMNQLYDLLFSYEIGLPKPIVLDKVVYLSINPCIVQIERTLSRFFKQIKDTGLPFFEIMFESMLKAGYTPTEIREYFESSSLFLQTEILFSD